MEPSGFFLNAKFHGGVKCGRGSAKRMEADDCVAGCQLLLALARLLHLAYEEVCECARDVYHGRRGYVPV